MSITDTSTLLRGNPPQKRTSVRFCLVRHFRHFPWHSDFCFPRSANEPVYEKGGALSKSGRLPHLGHGIGCE
ncbi:hypothetical protein [Prevotella sp. P2-180]|uniref:hypothetical protein n=1 Tax=Prevotella sp. P2-180 TaxID=2024224 RepID=UPI0011404EE9|nr:hypothetical protein [Prevotella sp. P2-180]